MNKPKHTHTSHKQCNFITYIIFFDARYLNVLVRLAPRIFTVNLLGLEVVADVFPKLNFGNRTLKLKYVTWKAAEFKICYMES